MEEQPCMSGMARNGAITLGSHGPAPEPARRMGVKPETFCVSGYTPFDERTGAVSAPLVLSATFHHPSLGESTGFDYSRGLNPTRLELERTVAALEHAEYALAFSSGMAAVSCLAKILSPGDEAVVSADLYGGTWRMFSAYERYGITFRYIDTSDLAAVRAAVTERTRLLFIETPSNPMMTVTDIAACADIVHSARADGVCAVDNTFLTPYFQNPLDFGADFVVHSGTKYLGGHHDLLAGFLVYSGRANDDFFRLAQMTEGAALAPFDAWLCLRGIKTLPLRMRQSDENARKVAAFLRTVPQVERVFYPGFPDAPGHELCARQARGFGGMISFYVRDGRLVPGILEGLRVIMFAESLGGVESLMTYPVTQTHNAIPPELRERVGVNARLLRLSVGVEDADDLIADLARAFAGAS